MNNLKKTLLAFLLASGLSANGENVEMFSYSLPGGQSGLRIAWRQNADSPWQKIGNGYNLVNSDFGAWGSHKKMISPKLMKSRLDGKWVCIWEADPKGGVTAVAYSPDLKKWSPQKYFNSISDIPRDIFPDVPLTPDSITIDGKKVGGYRQSVDSSVVRDLSAWVESREALAKKYEETLSGDSIRYKGLVPFTVKATVYPEKSKKITDKLIGIFFEDINYAADGGLYAELVQNRDFEYSPADYNKNGKPWNSMTAWSFEGDGKSGIFEENPLHLNNPHYIRISAGNKGARLINEGFDGIPLVKGNSYRLSVFARSEGKQRIEFSLVSPEGKTLAKTSVNVKSPEWKKYNAVVKASASCRNARLVVSVKNTPSVDLDMISLFPAKTFKGRENGLRNDLAKTLADLKPTFVRFPGGCVAHGNGVDNIYDWKGSIGPLESRKPLFNIWNYHQSRGLGYHEYFLFCEDIGAEPLPVLAAGVPCQNSSRAAHHSTDKITSAGQQNGIPMEEMDEYIQDVLDLIEYANGDVSTEWGAKRAAAGHPQPFNLKYIGIGNEDMITEVFEPRFKIIYNAVREKYPEIKVVGTVGPFYEGTDYDEGWRLARELDIPLVDEHYYVSPGWLVNNRNFYDSYKRDATKVYLGEWASHMNGRPSNIETALSEALYLTDLERNGDVVEMTSYAPLLAKEKHTQWRPDLIYFNNTEIKPTPNYFVQKLYGNNSGTRYIPTSLTAEGKDNDVMKRVGISVVEDESNGDIILKMVNMLPVATTIDINPESLGIKAGTYKAEILSGTPAQSKAEPVTTTVSLPLAELPPYSFTVVRLNAK